MIYNFTFDDDPLKNDWTFESFDKERTTGWLASEGIYGNKGATLTSPFIECDSNEGAYYSLEFESKASLPGYWAVWFYDENKERLIIDIYAEMQKTSDWRKEKSCFRGIENGKFMKLLFICKKNFSIRNVSLDIMTVAQSAKYCDDFYNELPALNYTPEPKRWELIPNTIKKMQNGEAIRLVMLGDSIINDTNTSLFDALLQRLYPQMKMKKYCSVRGSTGCWYYQDPVEFKKYVLDHNPDFLMIGGISHKDDIEAIEKVLKMAKEISNCEILLMSGPMAADWRPEKSAEGKTFCHESDGFAEKMEKLAEKMNVEFLDMYTLWHQYLAQSAKPWKFFHRDTVHANNNGRQILARILEGYFSPKVIS